MFNIIKSIWESNFFEIMSKIGFLIFIIFELKSKYAILKPKNKRAVVTTIILLSLVSFYLYNKADVNKVIAGTIANTNLK